MPVFVYMNVIVPFELFNCRNVASSNIGKWEVSSESVLVQMSSASNLAFFKRCYFFPNSVCGPSLKFIVDIRYKNFYKGKVQKDKEKKLNILV